MPYALPQVSLTVFTGTPDVSTWFEDAEYVNGPRGYRVMMREPGSAAFLAILDGEPVAFLHTTNPDYGNPHITIVVAPDRRRRGIGSASLLALTEVPELAHERLEAHVCEANAPAVRCCERAALRHAGTLDDGFVIFERPPRQE